MITVSKVERRIQNDTRYTAVVYEFIEEGENDRAVVQQVLDFLWRAGFGRVLVMPPCNWKGGVLIDLSDIVYPKGYGWDEDLFEYKAVETLLGWA